MIPHLSELVVRVFKADLPSDVNSSKMYVRVLFNGHGNSHDSSVQLEDHTAGMTLGQYDKGGNKNYPNKTLHYRGIGIDTPVAEEMGQSPVWNQEVRIPFHKYDKYTVLENFALQIRDASNEVDPNHSNFGSAAYVESSSSVTVQDHLVATKRMSINHLMSEPKGGWMQMKDSGPLGVTRDGKAVQKTGRLLPKPMWVNFYGSKFTGMQSLTEAKMNEGSPGIIPTDYRGRLLVQAYIEFVGPRNIDLTPEVIRGQSFMGDERRAFDTETRIKIVVKLPHDRELPDGNTRRVTVTCNVTNTAEQVLAAFNKQHGYYIPENFMQLYDGETRVTGLVNEEQVRYYMDAQKSSLEIRWKHEDLLVLKAQMPWSPTKIETLYADKRVDNVAKLLERLEKKVGIPREKFDLYFAQEPLLPERQIDPLLRDGYNLVLFWKKSLSAISVQEAEMNVSMYNRPRVYTLRFDLFQGMNFPEKVQGYELFVKVKIGDETFLKVQSDSKKVQKTVDGLSNYVEWGESFEHTWLKLPEDQDEIPDVYVYVCQRRIQNTTVAGSELVTEDRLGFLKLDVSHGAFPFNNRDPIWMNLEPDRLSPAFNNQVVMAGQQPQAGSLLFRMQFGAREDGTRHVVRNTKTVTGSNKSAFDQGTSRSVERLGDVARKYAGQQSSILDVMKDICIDNRRVLGSLIEEAVVDGLVNHNPPVTVEYSGGSQMSTVTLGPSKRHDVSRAFQAEFDLMCTRTNSSSGAIDPLQLKIREVFNTHRGMKMLDDVQLMHNMVLTVPKSTLPRAVKLIMPNQHTYELRAHVYQARDLQVLNDLMPDPYVEVSLGSKRIRSTSVKKSAYPRWNQILRLEQVELNLDPTANDHEFRKAINDYSRFAEHITVSIKDDDPLVKDHPIARFEVRMSEVDIVRYEDYERWERIQQEIEIKHLIAVQDNHELRLSPDAPPPNFTLQSLQAYLQMRKRPYSSQMEGTYTVNSQVKLLEPRRKFPAAPTKDDWWPCVPFHDERGRHVPIRDADQDMLSKRELFTRSQGSLLVYFQLLHIGPSRKNKQQQAQVTSKPMKVAEDHGIDTSRIHDSYVDTRGTAFITDKEFCVRDGQILEDMSKEDQRRWYENLNYKSKPTDEHNPSNLPAEALRYRQDIREQSIANLVQLPNLNRIAPASVNCMVEHQVWSVAELMPVAGRQVEHVFVEIDPGDQNDVTKRMRTRKHSTEAGCFEAANAYIKESHRMQMQIPEDPLYSPTFQIRVYDFRDGGTNKVLIGSAAVPLVRFLPDTWKKGHKRITPTQRVEYLEEWRLKSPLYRRRDVLEEVCSKMPLAKDAMHAELQRDIGRNQFYYIEVGDDFVDGSVFSNPQKGRHKAAFQRKMQLAQISYQFNWELQEHDDNKAQMEIMGEENFKEWKEKKALKRAFGAYTAMDGNPNVAALQIDKALSTQNPNSMYYRGPFDVDSTDLMPRAANIAGRRENPKIAGAGGRADTAGLLQNIEQGSAMSFTSLKPGDVYGPSAQFDPKSGYPINAKTGFAHDAITGLDIDPVTGFYLDSKTLLPIDPVSGFAFNRFTGQIFQPESGRACIFNHRYQSVIISKTRHEVFEQATMPEHDSGESTRASRKNQQGNTHLLHGRRRLYKPLEDDQSYISSIPFENVELYRGAEGTPASMKTYAGKMKFSASIVEAQNRHNNPSRFRFPRKNIYSVRVYVLHGYDIMGLVNRGNTQQQVLRQSSNADDAAAWIQKLSAEQEFVPDTMPMDGDHSNLYLRLRIGNQIIYDKPINDENNEDDGLISVHWSTSNPDFYCCIEADVMLPGVSDMYVEVWDHPLREEDPSVPNPQYLNYKTHRKHHPIGAGSNVGLHMTNRVNDYLVGSTKIDLQDRLPFTAKMEARPIEKRKLWSPTSNHAQGELEVMVDIMPTAQSQYTVPLPIERLCPKKEPFELRMIFWCLKEVDFRGEHYKNIVTNRPTDHINLPSHQTSLKRNKKNFFVRCTMKSCDMNRSPNYLWQKTQSSDTHYNVRADSDDGFYEGQLVKAIHPMHPGAEPEECRIVRRYGTMDEDIDRYDIQYNDGYVAKFVGPNGEEKVGKRIRIRAAEVQRRKFAMVSVNWRFQWKVNLPCSEPYIHVSLRDRNDRDKWCERTLDLVHKLIQASCISSDSSAIST
jgi:hypothetical protein